MIPVAVSYEERRALPYAAALAVHFGCGLVIHTRDLSRITDTTLLTEALGRIKADVFARLEDQPVPPIRVVSGTPLSRCQYVSEEPASRYPIQWYPADEERVRRRDAPIMVPLGNDPSAWPGVEVACRLAEHREHELIFYHTTWRDPHVSSSDPQMHWCADAKALVLRAARKAEDAGLSHRIMVETAPSIAEGIHQAALREHAMCIMLTRDPSVIAGDSVAQLLPRHVVPLAVVGEGGVNDIW